MVTKRQIPLAPERLHWGRSHLTEAEVRAVFSLARADGLMEYALVLVTYELALRAGELSALILDHCRKLGEGWLYIHREKGSAANWHLVSKPTQRALTAWIDECYPDPKKRPPRAHVFPRLRRRFGTGGGGLSYQFIYRLVRGYCERVNAPESARHPHALKRARTQHLLEEGQRLGLDPTSLLQSIAAVIGHRQAATTIKHYMTATVVEKTMSQNVLLRVTEEDDEAGTE